MAGALTSHFSSFLPSVPGAGAMPGGCGWVIGSAWPGWGGGGATGGTGAGWAMAAADGDTGSMSSEKRNVCA